MTKHVLLDLRVHMDPTVYLLTEFKSACGKRT